MTHTKINKWQWTYLQKRNRLKDIEYKLIVTKGENEDKLGLTDTHCVCVYVCDSLQPHGL